MTSDPLADVVSTQYSTWVYPAPILDLPSWLESNWQWFDPSHSHRILWPDVLDYREGMDVLVAGCGTNQAAVLAYTNPTASIVAIDVSESSLDHHRYLADKYALRNLELHRLPIEEVSSLGRDFDLIVSTGVLHHLADPLAGARALAQCLRHDGVLAVMLYARYGRIGVDMLQSVFRDLSLQQDEESLAVVRDALRQVPDQHPIRGYLEVAPDLAFDAGMVDTFLHGRERAYTIEECLELVQDAGLVFQDLLLHSPYYPAADADDEFSVRVARLPRERQWSIMERIHSRNACHFFMACSPDRDPNSYRVDFLRRNVVEYVPELRHACGVRDGWLHRPGWSIELTDGQAQIVSAIDGRRTVAEIAEKAMGRGASAGGHVISFLESLWKQDFISVSMPRG